MMHSPQQKRNALRRWQRKQLALAEEAARNLEQLIKRIREDKKRQMRAAMSLGTRTEMPTELGWADIWSELSNDDGLMLQAAESYEELLRAGMLLDTEASWTCPPLSLELLQASYEAAVAYIKRLPPKRRARTGPLWNRSAGLALLEAIDFVEEFVGFAASWKVKLRALEMGVPGYDEVFRDEASLRARYNDALHYMGYPNDQMKQLRSRYGGIRNCVNTSRTTNMSWVDVTGLPGSGSSIFCDMPICWDGIPPPAYWEPFFDATATLCTLVEDHPSFEAVRWMNDLSAQKVATVERMVTASIQTGLVQRILGFGWRLEELGRDINLIRPALRLTPVSVGVVFMEAALETPQARPLLASIAIAKEVFRERGVPVIEIDVANQGSDAARAQLIAFSARGVCDASASRCREGHIGERSGYAERSP